MKRWGLFAVLALFAVGCTHAADQTTKVFRFGMESLSGVIAVSTAPNGDVVVLEQKNKIFHIVRFTVDGKKVMEADLPAEVTAGEWINADANGKYYIAGSRALTVWEFQPNAPLTSLALKSRPTGMDLQHVDGADYLYLLGAAPADGVARYSLPDEKVTLIPLSKYPAAGGLSRLHVRSNGDLYAYSDNENLVWHFDAQGKFIEMLGGGGARPPQRGVPGDCMQSAFAVDANGDLYWTMGDYGALYLLTADGNFAVRYNGAESWNSNWVGPNYTVTGMTISGERAIALDGYNGGHLVSFPKSIVAPHAKDCDTVNPKLFGMNCRITSDKPYKLYTGATANLKLAFNSGNRHLHTARIAYTLYNLAHQPVTQGTLNADLPGTEAKSIDLPALALPLLGWYELDLAVQDGDAPLLERICFLARTQEDARTPIPAQEVSGWNDLQTHAMIGMGLHRFALGSNLKQLESPEIKAQMDFAVQQKIPYFVQLSDKGVCTPENVRYILAQCPKLPILEIMNEPDQQGVRPEAYVTILKACYEEAKRINPNVVIMGPAKCGIQLGWMEAFFKAGGGNYVDAVSVHAYERNNSMDAYHWQWKFAALRDMLVKYGCADKPIYQTEHGYLGNYFGIMQHRWQAHSLYLEDFVLDRFGVGIDKNYYYYVNEGGFADYPAYLVDANRELLPAAVLMRTRAHFLADKQFARKLDFGMPANWIALGNVYTGEDADVLVLLNCGMEKPLNVTIQAPANAKYYDCFGNPVTPLRAGGRVTLGVSMYPSYVVVPHGATINAATPPFGKDITAQATVSVSDPAAKHIDRLTNGIMPFDFEDEPLREPFTATAKLLPVSITFTFAAPHRFSQAVLYGMMADNGFCSPLDYDVEIRTDGQWNKVDDVNIPADGRVVKYDPVVKMLAWYDDPWIFLHAFPTPISGDAVRFTFTRMTQGQHVNQEINFRDIPQCVMARQIQIFAKE